jgi:hypothetical protein
MPAPTAAQKEAWFTDLQKRLETSLGMTPKTLAEKLPATSFSDLEQFCEDIQRRYVLELPEANIKKIVADRLKQWKARFAV